MFLRPTNKNELILYLNSLKNSCVPGMNEIDAKIIKSIHPYILFPDNVPQLLKSSVVFPVYKAGDKTNISNSRLISVLNNFSKIFEKYLKDT